MYQFINVIIFGYFGIFSNVSKIQKYVPPDLHSGSTWIYVARQYISDQYQGHHAMKETCGPN